MIIASERGILFKIRKLDHSNVAMETINITPTKVANGICSMSKAPNKKNTNKLKAAVIPDMRVAATGTNINHAFARSWHSHPFHQKSH